MNDDTVIWIEWIAACAGLLNVYLLTRQSLWNWPMGLLSVGLYASIFFHSRLYSDFLLHCIFFILQIYGWIKWSRPQLHHLLPVSEMSSIQRIRTTLFLITSTYFWSYFMQKNTNADYAIADAFILMTSLAAQYLMTMKKIEHWILWIVVDLVAITIYYLKALYVTSVLYVLFLILCVYGLQRWYEDYKKSNSNQIKSI